MAFDSENQFFRTLIHHENVARILRRDLKAGYSITREMER
jgi:hypothetical protein